MSSSSGRQEREPATLAHDVEEADALELRERLALQRRDRALDLPLAATISPSV